MRKYAMKFLLFVSLIFLMICVVGCGETSDIVEDINDDTEETTDSAEERAVSVKRITYATGAVGSPGNALATALSTMVNQSSENMHITPQTTGGTVEAMTLVASDEADISFIDLLMMVNALLKENYDEVYLDSEQINNLRLIATYLFGGAQIVTKADSGIVTIEDLRNKTISLGQPGSIAALVGPLLFQLHGLEEGVDYKSQYLLLGDAADALKDGGIDALYTLASGPIPQVMELDLVSPVYLVPLEPSITETITQLEPTWEVGEWATDVYDNQTNTEPVHTVFGRVGIGAHRDLEPELIYEILDIMYGNLDELHKAAPAALGVQIEEQFICPVPMPLHQGAYNYYIDKGWIILPEHEPQEEDFIDF